MRLILDPTSLPRSAVALGMFDGVHLGHQALIRRSRALADRLGVPLSVCTFEPHPAAVLFPDRAPRRLTSPGERAALMAAQGVDTLCVHRFTREVADLPPAVFLERFTRIYRPAAVVCGFNFTFGARGKGNCGTLRAWGAETGTAVEVIPAVTLAGETVSSTRVRALLAAGDCKGAAALLGRPYAVNGTAERTEEGFLALEPRWQKALPAPGRYLCGLNWEDGQEQAEVEVTDGCPALRVHAEGRGAEWVRVAFLRRIGTDRP